MSRCCFPNPLIKPVESKAKRKHLFKRKKSSVLSPRSSLQVKIASGLDKKRRDCSGLTPANRGWLAGPTEAFDWRLVRSMGGISKLRFWMCERRISRGATSPGTDLLVWRSCRLLSPCSHIGFFVLPTCAAAPAVGFCAASNLLKTTELSPSKF